MTIEPINEIWQVESNGAVFDTTFIDMTFLIDQGTLGRQDKVRKGNLRWIEAGKVPSLLAVFNAKDNGEPLPVPTVTTTQLGPDAFGANAAANPVNPTPTQVSSSVYPQPDQVTPDASVCSVHPDTEAAYTCDTCLSLFCKACPNSYGGSVKVCPMCGAMCSSLAAPVPAAGGQVHTYVPASTGFGFGDFGEALAYPFKFKGSLIIGAVMYMFFSIGQGVVGFGGIYMLGGAIFSFMLANTLTFGVLSNTVENFSQGKIGQNFMPSFDDFSVWDDVFHPFFLSIGVYISSFGPLIAVGLLAFFLVVGTVNKEMNGFQSDAARAVNPDLPYAANAAKQSDVVRKLVQNAGEYQKRRVEQMQKGEIEQDQMPDMSGAKNSEDADFERMNQMIQQQRKAQLESAVGKTPETRAQEQAAMIKQILGYGALFIILGGICLLWGLFYFPAACAVAGYTQSFSATLNPTVGLDTIRRLGVDYIKILLMGLAVAVMSGIVGGVVGAALSAFDMPGVGNVPARAITSLFGFYFSVVFSCVIGFAMYKGAERLKLYQ